MKRGAKENLLGELKLLPFFNKKQVFHIGENKDNYDLKKSTIDTYISRYLKDREIIALKRELYVTADFYNKNKNETSYLFYLANVLRAPSYISSWTALQYYNLATEIIHTITSVTTKVTMNYNTKVGAFSYQSIKDNSFSDFNLVKDKFDFFIAYPSKALFDLLYFKTQQFRGMSLNDVNLLIEELRIDIVEMDESEKEKFYLMIKDYISYE